MKIRLNGRRKARIEMLPLIDIVFLLLVFFIYAMLSMAVHHSLPVALPDSRTARLDREASLSVTLRRDGAVFVDRAPVDLDHLTAVLREKRPKRDDAAVLLFADRQVSYEALFRVLDRIRMAGLDRISLQAEAESPE